MFELQTGETPAPSPPPSTEAVPVHRVAFHGDGGELFQIFIMNVFTTLITLGVYVFWAKVKTRRYIWAHTEFAGDRFSFHGTGKELLIGALKAGLLYAILFGANAGGQVAFSQSLLMLGLVGLLFFVGVIALTAVARVGAMRYRLARTSWRGIRLSFRGSYKELLQITLRGTLLTAVTLGLYQPYYHCRIRRYLVEHTRFGSQSLAFDDDPAGLKALWKQYVRFIFATAIGLPFCLVAGGGLLVPLIGALGGMLAVALTAALGAVLWCRYFAARRRFYWSHTTVAGARFENTVDGMALWKLHAVNGLLLIGTLGLATPWVTVRTKRYDLEHLALNGAVDFPGIMQEAQAAPAAGEELASFFDVDALPG
jgi:uncharacterized membrane protein YjgN (DUF898 family)